MNIEQVENFFVGFFGDGVSSGAVSFLSQDSQATDTIRDFQLIEDFLFLNEGQTILCNMMTVAGELVAIGATNSSLPPTGYIVKGDSRVPIWGLDKAYSKPEDLDYEDLWFPIPGVNGWKFEVVSGDVYSLEELSSIGEGIDKDRLISIAFAGQHTSNDWKNIDATFGNLIEILLDHKEGPKEGSCILQGKIFESKGQTRKASMMIENYIICLDLDNGTTINEIDTALAGRGLAYVRYTTHSHNGTHTDISKKQYSKVYGEDNEPNIANFRDFLQNHKGYTAQISATATSYSFIQKPDGDFYRVQHGPVSKNRLIFFLKEPFKLRGEGVPASAPEKWKEKYLGFAESIGLKYDRACTDAARLFYLPRHDKDKPFEAKFFDGDSVDLFSYQSLKPRDVRGKVAVAKIAKAKNPAEAAANFIGMSNDPSFTLPKKIGSRAFDIVTAIRDTNPDFVLDDKARGGKGSHIVCPNEDMHSKTGGFGTYAVNGTDSDDGKFELHCTHAHCFEMGKWGLLQLMIDRGDYLPENVFDTDDYCVSIVADEEEEQKENAAPVEKKEAQVTPKSDGGSDTAAPKREKNKKDKSDSKEKRGFTETLQEMNKRYAVVTGGEDIVIDFSHPNKTTRSGFVEHSFKSFDHTSAEYTIEENGKPALGSKYWLKWSGKNEYVGFVFDPSESCGSTSYNTYMGMNAVSSEPGDWTPFKRLLLENICDNNIEEFNYAMTFMAHIIQRPWEKRGVAWVIRGSKGIGKSLLTEFLQTILNPYTHKSGDPEHIFGKFNGPLERSLLCIIEEAFFAGDASKDSKLKEMITGNTLSIERKGSEQRSVKNYTRYIIISNSSHVVNASSDERRYFCSHAKNNIPLEERDAFFGSMFEDGKLSMKIVSHVFNALQTWVPPYAEGWDVLNRAMLTTELTHQKRASIKPEEMMFISALENGAFIGEGADPIILNYDRPTNVNLQEIYSIWKRKAGKYGSEEEFEDRVKEYLDDPKKSLIDATGSLTYEVKSVKDLREIFSKKGKMILKDFKVELNNKPARPVLVAG